MLEPSLNFTKAQLTDHEFAAWLRERGALADCRKSGRSNAWFNADGACVALALYDGAASTFEIHLRTDA